MNLSSSQTAENLARAYALECETRARYTFFANRLHSMDLIVLERLFRDIADQELAHAEQFLLALSPMEGAPVTASVETAAALPDQPLPMLRAAQALEFEEYDRQYSFFAQAAAQEGFGAEASLFTRVAAVEKLHHDRIGRTADLLEQGRLFTDDAPVSWLCLHCGHVEAAPAAPGTCPICARPQGYFLRSGGAR